MGITTKVFTDAEGQAVRLPREVELPDGDVTITRTDRGILIEPVRPPFDVDKWRAGFEALGRDPTFFPNGREQPPMPDDGPTFD